MPNVIPIGATCRPCVAKNLKIALWVTYIPALCAARNAAGKKTTETEKYQLPSIFRPTFSQRFYILGARASM